MVPSAAAETLAAFCHRSWRVGGDRVVTCGILGDDHSIGMVDALCDVDGIVPEHGPRLDVEGSHFWREKVKSFFQWTESERVSWVVVVVVVVLVVVVVVVVVKNKGEQVG